MYVCIYVWSSRIAEYGSTVYGCHSCSWTAEHKHILHSPRPRLRIWSRETGPAFPSRARLLILYDTRREADSGPYSRDSSPPAFYDGVHSFITSNTTWSVPSLSAQQLRTDGVHHQESTGEALVVLLIKIVPVTVLPFQVSQWTQWTIFCTPLSLFPHSPLLHHCSSS